MRLLVLALICGLSGCAPAGIPSGAKAHWELKGSFYWTWTQNFKNGCAVWMAKDGWASLQLLVNSKCEGSRATGYLAGRGLSYFSVEDHLTFNGYWPWSQEEYFKLIVYDKAGMISDVRPCPYSLSVKQTDEMRLVAQEAISDARTDRERRVLARVRQRLAALDGKNLASSQQGCTDYDASVEEVDVWKSR